MNEQALVDLATSTGPIGTMVLALGFIIKGWVAKLEAGNAKLEAKVDALAKSQNEDAVVDAKTSTKVEELDRRVSVLEQRKAGA